MTHIAREKHEHPRATCAGQAVVLFAHAGRPFAFGRLFVALKIANEDDTMANMIRLQLKLTPLRANFAILTLVLIARSLACSFSVTSSRFSRRSSSRQVGLSGVLVDMTPGDLSALFRGDAGVRGIWTDSCSPAFI
jgi:hypothetical protein